MSAVEENRIEQSAAGAEDALCERTFTQKEVDQMIRDRLERDRRVRGVSPAQKYTQEDVDRIVSEELERARRVGEGDQQAQDSEPDRSADDAPEQGAAPETRQGGEAQRDPELIRRIQELEQRAMEYEAQAVRARAREILAARGLPGALANVLDYSSAEACHASIESIDGLFREAVRESVERRLGNSTVKLPRTEDVPDYGSMTDDAYFKAVYGEKWAERR